MEAIQQLAKPLAQSQIDAASRFWKEGWESKEFAQLKEAFPNPDDAVRIKAIVVNTLYGTKIFAITKVADCVERVLRTSHPTGPDLVEQLVAEIREEVTNRNNYSFVSKYAHFFIDLSLPILDWYAEWMLGEHLGRMQSKNPKRYHKFTENVETLKRVAGLKCDCAMLDAYLWVAGEYWYWSDHPKVNVNSDLKAKFEKLLKNAENEPVLASLLGLNTNVPAPEHKMVVSRRTHPQP